MQRGKSKNNKKDKLIEGLILCGVSAVLLLILFGAFGKSGLVVADFLRGIFGYAIFGVAFGMLTAGICCLVGCKFNIEKNTMLGGILMFVAFVMIFQVVTGKAFVTSYGGYLKGCYEGANTAGGALFGLIVYPVAKLNYIFAIILFSLIFVGAVAIAFFVKINEKTNWRWHATKKKQPAEINNTATFGAEGVNIAPDLNVVTLGGVMPKDKIGHIKDRQGHGGLKSIDELDNLCVRGEVAEERETRVVKIADVPNLTVSDVKTAPPDIDEALTVLYESNAKEEKARPSGSELSKEDAAKKLYGQEERPAPKVKKHEFTKEDYETYTNNARMRTVIEEQARLRGQSIPKSVDDQINEATGVFYHNNDDFDERIFDEAEGNNGGNTGQNDLDANVGKYGSDNIGQGNNIAEIDIPGGIGQKSGDTGLTIDNGSDSKKAEDKRGAYRDFNKSEAVDLSATNLEPTQSFEDMLAEKNRIREAAEQEERMRSHKFRDVLQGKKDEDQSKRDALAARKEELLKKRAERSDKGGTHANPTASDNATIGRGINFGLPTKPQNAAATQPVVVTPPQYAVTSSDGGDKASMPKPSIRPYKPPHIALLKEYQSTPPENEDFSDKINILENMLVSFGVSAKVVNVVTGPTFTRLELQMPVGISVNKINALGSDIAMCLEATSIRLQTPIPGKNLFGVELPNKTRGTVGLKALFNSPEYNNSKTNISFAMGQDCDGHQYVIDLTKAPHMLIAGATGAGKSVCINTLICSILYKYSPLDVKIALVDPKQVELSMYNGLPHMLVEESIYDKDKVLNLLDWAIDEMEARYGLLKSRRVNSIGDFNELAKQRGEEKLPYIVIIIDEVADIVMSLKKEFEERIVKIAQKARAAGIILVLATQRPSVDIVTGTIKANLPTRIAFAVASQVDSKTIIDTAGAEKLLRLGDMLYMAGTNPTPVRVQGAFIDGREVDAVCEYIKQNNDSYFDPDIAAVINKSNKPEQSAKNAEITGGDSDIDGEFVKVLKYVVDIGECSASKLQRRFGYGFPKAAKFVDKMEDLGYIGKSIDNKKREVYLDKETFMTVYGEFELE